MSVPSHDIQHETYVTHRGKDFRGLFWVAVGCILFWLLVVGLSFAAGRMTCPH